MGDVRGISPMSMTGNLAENWKIWRQRFENYLVASEIIKKDQKTQIAQLLHYFGEDSFPIYNSFVFEEDEDKKLANVLKKFEDHFLPKKNLSYERFLFFTRKQQPGESIEQFVTDLKNKSSSCEFGTLKDSLVKDIMTCGLTDVTLREKLLQSDSLSLAESVKLCVSVEKSREQSTLMGASTSSVPVEVVQKGCRNKKAQNNGQSRHRSADVQRQRMERAASSARAGPRVGYQRGGKTSYEHRQGRNFSCCFRCGGSHARNSCPAMGKKCLQCGLANHFASVCINKRVHVVDYDSENVSEDDYLYIDSIQINKINS